MNTFVTICGWTTIIALCVALAALAVYCAFHGFGNMMERFYQTSCHSARHDMGLRIRSSAHWFSECQDTGLLMQIIGDRIIKTGTFEPDEVRHEWRNTRKQRRANESGAEHGN